MWTIAALAFMPLAAISFAAFAVLVAIFPEATPDIGLGVTLLIGAVAIGAIVAVPLSVLAVARMITERERRMLRD